MKIKNFLGIGLCGALGVCGGFYAYDTLTAAHLSAMQTAAGLENSFEPRQTVYGDYLSSQFAQQRHDWVRAGQYLDNVIAQTPDDVLVLKRAMILAMGAGETAKSIDLAKKVEAMEKDNALAMLFLAAEALREKNYAQADKYLKQMPAGSLSDFIMPLIEGWTSAGLGKFDGERLSRNIVHMHHAILIADYLGKKDQIEKFLTLIQSAQGATPGDKERIADIYASIGRQDKALELYAQALKDWPENPNIPAKISDLKAGKEIKSFDHVKAPEYGVAMALYNMAQVLYQEYADESARVFANIALYLDPSMTDAQLLLAAITSRNERMGDAINYYRSIKPGSEFYLESRRRAADLLEDSKRTEEALAELDGLVKEYNDVEALIRIGDIYRRQEDFQKALLTYNQAEERLGKNIPKQYWHLLYARGMSLERLGQWAEAETDLKAALSFQPDHPYVLNYLAYAWTDQGKNLEEALGMLKKAVKLRPSDGYITDSLGWVYYRMGRYKEAIPHLEAAVELLPYDPVINDHLGDAYWQAGRKLEARFQWQRAKNFAEDQSFIVSVDHKLQQGLSAEAVVKQAHSETPPAGDVMKP